MARYFFFLGHEELQPEEIVKLSQKVEGAGFDGVAVSEHFHPWVDDKGASGFAFSTLGAIAVKTRKLKLLTAVTSPLFRFHPALIAQAAATIDRLSNGRFELGLGTGETLNERPLGLPFPKYKERSERMREALEIIKELFSGEKLTFKGRYYQTDRARLYSPPTHNIPIYLAAAGPKSATLAGEQTDGVLTSVKKVSDTLENVVKPAQNAAKSVGNRRTHVIAGLWSIIAKNEAEAWKAIEPWRGLRTPSKTTAVDPMELRLEADAMERQEILSKFNVVSSSGELTRSYTPLLKILRADTVIVQVTSVDIEDTINTIGKKVLPELKRL